MKGKFSKNIHYVFSNKGAYSLPVYDKNGNLAETLKVLPASVTDRNDRVSYLRHTADTNFKNTTVLDARAKRALPIAFYESSCIESLKEDTDRLAAASLGYFKSSESVTVRVYAQGLDNQSSQLIIVIDDKFLLATSCRDVVNSIAVCGVDAGGLIKAKFKWAKVNGGHPKLIRVGSELYRSIQKSEIRSKLSPLNPSTLKVGNVYLTKGGQPRLFLGTVDSERTADQCMWYLLDKVNWQRSQDFDLERAQDKFNDFLRGRYLNCYMPNPYHWQKLKKHAISKGINSFSSKSPTIDRILLSNTSSVVERAGSLIVGNRADLIYRVHESIIHIMRANIAYYNAACESRLITHEQAEEIIYWYYRERGLARPCGKPTPEVAEFTDEWKLLKNFVH